MRNDTVQKSRRALVVGAAGGVAALAAQSLGTTRAQAANGDPLILGQSNSASAPTELTTSTGQGLIVHSGDNNGVQASTDHASGAGVLGTSNSETGGYGVAGFSRKAYGVLGQSIDGFGVFGTSDNSFGVAGAATGATGVAVSATANPGATALRVQGPAEFNRSGIETVPAQSSSVTKTGITLSSKSLVFATLQENRRRVFVQAAVPNPSAGSFTVHLNKKVRAATKVGWFVIDSL
jgi:hypothetical protein